MDQFKELRPGGIEILVGTPVSRFMVDICMYAYTAVHRHVVFQASQKFIVDHELYINNQGRLIDMVKMKATNFRRVSFLVLDEADRMFDLGFGGFLG